MSATTETASSRGARVAERVLQAGGFAVVLAAAPYKSFELDRFFVPKELVLHATALLAAAALLLGLRRLAIGRADQLIALFLALGVVSALFATNPWLAQRAVAVSLSGAACFWCARAVSRAGYGRQLAGALAAAAVLGAGTALAQAYGIRTDFFSLNRAPGGTFGNRNFMAHLCAIAMPAIVLAGLRAPTRAGTLRWGGALAVIMAALILSRSRAAWLALAAGLFVLLVAGAFAFRRRDGGIRLRRFLGVLVIGAAGAALSLVLPNTLDWRSDSPYLDTAKSVVDYKGGSGRGRLVQYGNSLRMSLRHPLLGVGPGNWAVVYPRFASRNDPSLADDGMTSNPWPSSDWVTFVSERGLAALVILALAVLSLAADAVRTVRTGEREEERLVAATLLGTLAALVVVGTFDAVLLLPVAALVAWALVGALASPARVRREVTIGAARRVAAAAALLLVGGVAVARSTLATGAMAAYDGTSRAAALERAATLDPGSFRIRLRLAQEYARRGDCRRGRPHATAARALFPESASARRAAAACGR